MSIFPILECGNIHATPLRISNNRADRNNKYLVFETCTSRIERYYFTRDNDNSPWRAVKDARNRKRAARRLLKQLNSIGQANSLVPRCAARVVRMKDEGSCEIDAEEIAEAARRSKRFAMGYSNAGAQFCAVHARCNSM